MGRQPIATDSSKELMLTGVVLDPSGATVQGASVTLVNGRGGEAHGTSDPAGRFALAVDDPPPFTVIVVRKGFAALTTTLDAPRQEVMLTLAPARVEEAVTVTSTIQHDTVSTATKTATPLLVVPQAVAVVDRQLLESQAAVSMQDALQNVAGVGVNLGEGRRDQFLIRGFSAQHDLLADGVRDDAPYFRDVATIERIEVVKGPAAALFGRGSSGGVINRILKTPLPGSDVTNVSVSAGSLGVRRLTADLNRRSRSQRWAFRVAAAGEDSSSFRDGYFLRRGTIVPSLLWQSDVTMVSGQLEYLRDARLPDRGLPSLDGGPADVPIAQNFGYPADDRIDTTARAATIRFERRLANGLTVRNVFRSAAYDTNFSNTAPRGMRLDDDGWRVLRQQYNSEQHQRNLFNQSELVAGLRLGMLTHAVVAGLELGSQSRDQVRFNGVASDVTLANPVLTRPVYATDPAVVNRFDGGTVGVYAQDQLAVGARWKALVGARIDRYLQTLDDRTRLDADARRADVNWSPRAGLVFQPTATTSLYASVSRSFQPSGEGLSLALNAADLKPETSRNIEAGAKASLFGERATGTVSVFRLDRTNIKTTDPEDPTRLALVGRQRSDGVEIAIDGDLADRWTLHASGALFDAVILKSNTVTNGVPLEGNRPGLVSPRSATVWSSWGIGAHWRVGAGGTAVAQRFATNDDLVKLPGYARFDAATTWQAGTWVVGLNARNLFNGRYYETAASDFQIYPGAPRELVVTLRVGR
jgi:catecholate siderophore receptor